MFSIPSANQLKIPRRKQSGDHVIHVWSNWNRRAELFARAMESQGASLFQSSLWLQIWYETFTTDPNIEPVIVAIEDVDRNEPIMLLPLYRHIQNNFATIGFVDLGLADYCAPLIHPELNLSDQQANQLIQDICAALPKADLLKLEKVPHHILDKENPLSSIAGMHDSSLCHYGIETTAIWDDYWTSLKRSFRKDQRRRWRVLEKKGEVSFTWCRDRQQVLPLFETLANQQRKRLQGLGLPYLLDQPNIQKFYRQLIEQGCTNGPIIFTALLVDGQPVATLCGLGNGRQYAMTLSGNETGDWSKCSPGRLLTERTMQTLHENGYRYFDFTIGDEPYKKYFAKQQGCLQEYFLPLSWKALPYSTWMKIKSTQRKSEWAASLKKTVYKNK